MELYVGFLLAPGTGLSRFWGFGFEIEAAPALKKPTVIYIWDGKGTGKLAVMLCRCTHLLGVWQQATLAESSEKSLKMKDK